MNHSPAKILADILVAGELFTIPSVAGSWPLYVSSMPDGDAVEDDCAAVYDTAGRKEG